MILIGFIYLLSLGYLLLAFACLEKFHRFRKNSHPSSHFQPPVTVIKPVCGLTPELEENLLSFCLQDYPEFQVIFGLNDENDPAIPVLRKIIDAHPEIDITLVINQRLSGKNYKVSNLVNMYPYARHGTLVIADDDIRVPNNYLNEIVAPFADQETGAVTCLYSGTPKGGIISSLHAMFINEWFLPSALISHTLKKNDFCFGATLVIKRETLAEIGGFEVLADYLADDYMLGKLVADHGHKIHLSHLIVQNIIQPTSLKSVLLNETRWARTMRTVEPVGYTFTLLTDTLIIGCFTGAIFYFYTRQFIWPVLIIGTVLLVRILFHLRVNNMLDGHGAGSVWLIPVRDFLTFCIRLASFTSNTIEWKNRSFSVKNGGVLLSQLNQPIIPSVHPEGISKSNTGNN